MSRDPTSTGEYTSQVSATDPEPSVDIVPLERLGEADLPRIFGRYELQSVLGEGGMARVFLAELRGPAGFRKRVALKVIKGQVNEQEVEDLIQEARIGGRLKHPHVVDVYEFGEVEGSVFISMELVDGLTLARLVRSSVSVPAAVVLQISIAVTSGLVKAHGLVDEGRPAGLVHCDLKPSNILVSWDGEVKIVDFGIASFREDERSDRPKKVRGSLSYMSPEHLRGEGLDGRSDLFALGMVIASMVLGKHPLAKHHVFNTLKEGGDLRSPLFGRAICAQLDEAIPGLSEVLLRCVAVDRADRFADASELNVALRVLQETVGFQPRLATWFSLEGDEASASQRSGAVSGSHTQDSTAGTLSRSPGNLGVPTRGFVGRASELEKLASLFDEGARLITLTGTGGCGKTRIARRFARNVLGELQGGAWFVDLTEARSAMGVLHSVAAALEVPLTSEDHFDALVTCLGHAIAGRGSVILVLDNFEQVVEHAEATVGRWREAAPEARFLITSREPVRLRQEALLPVGPMPEKDGVELFEERAQTTGATLTDSIETQEAIARIVREFDGLPLAIELAAARARVLSPQKILERLSKRFDLLKASRTDVAVRHATLRGTIDWSWDLLKPWEQSALAQLAVFHGGFFMEAAEEVLDLSAWPEAPWSLDVVGSLLDKSLLHSREVLSQPRFAMYVSIQEYASERLERLGAQAVTDTRARHAAYYARFGSKDYIRSLWTHGGSTRFKALEANLENFLAGVDAALAAGDVTSAVACALAATEVMSLRGPLPDGVTLLQRLLARGFAPELSERLHGGLGYLEEAQGHTAEALEHYQEALRIQREGENPLTVGNTVSVLGQIHWGLGAVSVAMDHYQQALAIHREVGDRRGEGKTLRKLGIAAHDLGHVPEALAYYRQSLVLIQEAGDRRNEALCLGSLAILRQQRGEIALALEAYDQALSIARETGDRRFQGYLLGNLAILRQQEGDIAGALEHYQRALAIHRMVGNRRGQAVILGNLGDLYYSQGETAEADSHLQLAIEICDTVFPMAAAAFRGSLAIIRMEQGEVEVARTLIAEGEPQLRGLHALELAKLLCRKARVEQAAGDPASAQAAFDEAEAISVEISAGGDSDLVVGLAAAREALAD